MGKINLLKIEQLPVKTTEKNKEKNNPAKASIDEKKSEYAKCKNDKERLDYLAKTLGVL